MDNVTVKDVILEKKLDNYNFDENNFSAPGELMITITLREYRELVQKAATSDTRIKEAESNKYSRDAENKRLSEEVSKLKAELYELNMRYCNGEEIK